MGDVKMDRTITFFKWAYQNFLFNLKFCRLWLTRTRLAFNDLYTDQELLFKGATCKLFWKTRGAYKIDLFLNDQRFDSYAPEEVAIIPITSIFNIRCVVYGAFETITHTLTKHVIPTTFKDIEHMQLADFTTSAPGIIADIAIGLPSFEPNNLIPIIDLPELSLESSQMRAEEQQLNFEIETA